MIKTAKHAKEVQQRRVAAGKRGYAKAVRRFYARNGAPAKADASLVVLLGS